MLGFAGGGGSTEETSTRMVCASVSSSVILLGSRALFLAWGSVDGGHGDIRTHGRAVEVRDADAAVPSALSQGHDARGSDVRRGAGREVHHRDRPRPREPARGGARCTGWRSFAVVLQPRLGA